MRVFVESDEMYPVFMVSRERNWPNEHEVELSEEDYAAVCRVSGEYWAWQAKLKALYGWD